MNRETKRRTQRRGAGESDAGSAVTTDDLGTDELGIEEGPETGDSPVSTVIGEPDEAVEEDGTAEEDETGPLDGSDDEEDWEDEEEENGDSGRGGPGGRGTGGSGRGGRGGSRGGRGTPDRRGPREAPRRTTPAQFLREVRDELRQVAWPTRSEMVNYTTVVFTTLVIMITLIFLLNYGFGKLVVFLFQK